jgi:hypothetical protein
MSCFTAIVPVSCVGEKARAMKVARTATTIMTSRKKLTMLKLGKSAANNV